MRSFILPIVTWIVVFWSFHSSAQQTSGRDIIKLKNGGIERGTITELVPNEKVTMMLLSGETRSHLMSEVVYAGPEKQAPGSLPPETSPGGQPDSYLTVHTKKIRIHFVTDDGQPLTLQLQGGQADVSGVYSGFGDMGSYKGIGSSFTNVCSAPCDFSLPAGMHTFALKQMDGDHAVVDDALKLDHDMTLQGRYNDRSGLRTAGAVTGLIGTAAFCGAMIWGAAIAASESFIREPQDSQLVAPVVTMGVGLLAALTGLILYLQNDSAELTPVVAASR